MPSSAIVVRQPPSGPVLDPVAPGNLLTVNADGVTWSSKPPPPGGVTSVFGRTGAVVAQSGDYEASQITNDSTAPGLSSADALTLLANTPEFPATHDNGNSGAAIAISFAANLAQLLTLTANCTMTFSGFAAGKSQWAQMKIVQGGAGSFTLAITGAKTPGGAGLTLSTAIGAIDILSLFWDGATLFAQVCGLGFA